MKKPPYQPGWILKAQVCLLRRHKLAYFDKHYMVITTTGRKTRRKYSIPIGFARDDNTYLALNMGGKSNWYRNALANPCVTLEVEGKTFAARAEQVPVDTPEKLQKVLAVYKRERPGAFENFFQTSLDVPAEQLMDIGKYASFVRFIPIKT